MEVTCFVLCVYIVFYLFYSIVVVLYCVVLHRMVIWVEGILLYSATTIAYFNKIKDYRTHFPCGCRWLNKITSKEAGTSSMLHPSWFAYRLIDRIDSY